MMRRLTISLLSAFVAFGSSGAAPTTHIAEVEAEIASSRLRILVASLSASDEQERKDAQARLVEIGEGVQETIAEMQPQISNPEAWPRAQEVLRQVKYDVSAHAMLRPTLVTLHADRKPAREVLESLFMQAGARLRSFPPNPWELAGDAPVTLHVKDVPFWHAVRNVEKQAGVAVVDAGWGMAVQPVTANDRRAVSIHGPFMIVTDGARWERITLFVEPKVRIAWHPEDAAITMARDDRIHWPVVFQQRSFFSGPQGQTTADGDVLRARWWPTAEHQHATQLTGYVTALMVSQSQPVNLALHPPTHLELMAPEQWAWVGLKTPMPGVHIVDLKPLNLPAIEMSGRLAGRGRDGGDGIIFSPGGNGGDATAGGNGFGGFPLFGDSAVRQPTRPFRPAIRAIVTDVNGNWLLGTPLEMPGLGDHRWLFQAPLPSPLAGRERFGFANSATLEIPQIAHEVQIPFEFEEGAR
jgi:hypothetical protein